MHSRLARIWNRYVHADERQLALFPDWERAQWLAPMPSIAAALGLLVLFVVGTPSVPLAAKAMVAQEETAPEADNEADEPDSPEYDLAAIPDYIKAAAQRYRLSESLIAAVISVESNWDHEAVSPKGARGLMQLMPQTSKMIGVRDPHSPDENIDAGASHLRAMLDTFKGDLPLALAAYNAGEQNVIRYRRIPRSECSPPPAAHVPPWCRCRRLGPSAPPRSSSRTATCPPSLPPARGRSRARRRSPRPSPPAPRRSCPSRNRRSGPARSPPGRRLRYDGPRAAGGRRAKGARASMRFGVFYEHQLPRPWAEGSEQQLFQDALSQVELADRLGIDYAWEVEHHF